MPRCIVYVPGSSQHVFKQSAKIIAERIATCIRHEIGDRAEFRHRIEVTASSFDFSTEIPADVASIQCDVGGQWVTALKIIEIKYLEAFAKPFADLPVLERGFRALLLAFTHGKLIRSVLLDRESPKTRLDKSQCAYLSLIILVCVVFLIYWLAVAALAVLGVDSLGGASSSLATVATIVGVLTLGGLSLKSYLDAAEKSAIEFYSITGYLDDPGRSSGTLNAIIEAVGNAHRNKDCTGVDVVCFSLGAILTCDAIFPRRARLWSPVPSISDLITIGHPYDLVVSAIPEYYEARQPLAMTYRRWMNVCTTDDFLGSNFRYDEKIGDQAEPQLGIACEGKRFIPSQNVRFDPPLGTVVEKSGLDMIVPFRRVGNHALYWDDSDPNVPNCFQQIVQRTGWAEDVIALIRAGGAPLQQT